MKQTHRTAPLLLTLAMVLSAFGFTACNKVVVDSVGEPFAIKLKILQTSGIPQSVDLSALVALGYGKRTSTVTFLNGADILATISESVPHERNPDPQSGDVFE